MEASAGTTDRTYLPPRCEKWSRCTIVRDQDDGGIGFKLENLRPSQIITAVGRDFGAGSILPARAIGIARGM